MTRAERLAAWAENSGLYAKKRVGETVKKAEEFSLKLLRAFGEMQKKQIIMARTTRRSN